MKNYIKKQVQPMMPWDPSLDMKFISISDADKESGSPKQGDMVAVNPNDNKDRWLVAEKFFIDNYKEA